MSATQVAEPLLEGGFTVPEAPRWHAGALWFSDFFTRRVLRYDPADRSLTTVCEVPGRPSGLGFMPDGGLRIVSMDDCRLLSWDGERLGEVAEFGDVVTGPANDMAISSAGTAFVGNFGVDPERPWIAEPTSLLSITADGRVRIAAEDVVFPNGIVIDEDRGMLWVNETYRCRITAFRLDGDALSDRRTWVAFAEDPVHYDIPAVTATMPLVPDGLAQDAEGMFWVADAKGHGIGRIDPAGRTLDFVETGDLAVYSAVLGGPDGCDLFLTCAPPVETVDTSAVFEGAVLKARARVPARTDR